MTTPTPQPSAYARERLDELISCGCIVEMLAVTTEGTMLVLMDGAIPMLIAHDVDTPRAELSRQVFVVCACAEQSFQQLLRSHVDENLRLAWMH